MTLSVADAGTPQGRVSVPVEIRVALTPPPEIASAAFDGRKRLTIAGMGFGAAPRVLVNGVDQTAFRRQASDTEILLVKKARKLGLVTGDNTIEVIHADGSTSNVYVLRL